MQRMIGSLTIKGIRRSLLGVVALVVVALAPAYGQVTYQNQWGSLGDGGAEFDAPNEIAVSPAGDVYVVDRSNNRVQKFDSAGNYLTEWGGFNDPAAVAVDPNSAEIYVGEFGDPGNNRIQKFDVNGALLDTWTGFGSISSLAVNSNGKVFATIYDTDKVLKLSTSGVQEGEWGTGVNAPFNNPVGVAVDLADNRVYISDHNSIFKYNPSGTQLAEWNVGFSAVALAVDAAGTVYATRNSNDQVYAYDGNGTELFTWGGTGTGVGEFDRPTGLAAGAGGAVYVADANNDRVQKFVAGSHLYLTKWGGLTWPRDAAIDGAGNIYVAETSGERVTKFDSEGVQLAQWGSAGTGNGQFNNPTGVAVDAADNVFVADRNNHRVQKFDSAGNYLTQWGGLGSGNGQFSNPTYLAVDTAGNVYVGDRNNDRIQKFDNSGNYLTEWGSLGSGNSQFNNPTGIVVDGSDIYVADTDNHRIQKFDTSGNYITQWGSLGTGDGQFDSPLDVAVNGEGYVYVTDWKNDRMQKFDGAGNYITQWGITGNGDGEFNGLTGLAVDGSTVYVVDTANARIQKFIDGAQYASQWGSAGSGSGGSGLFNRPTEMAVNAAGEIYVVDSNNDRIQKFDGAGNYLTQWGHFGSDDGEFNSPSAIAIDPSSGAVFVGESDGSGNNRLQKFSTDGAFLAKWSGFNNIQALAVDNAGNIYVTAQIEVLKLDGNGVQLAQWPFTTPVGLAVDPVANFVYVSYAPDQISKLDSNGNILATWGGSGSGLGQFASIPALAVDAASDVYAVDRDNNRIQKFANDGTFLAEWGSLGSGDGQFDSPRGVATGSGGIVYASDRNNHRVQKFAVPALVRISLPTATAVYNQALTVPVELSHTAGIVAAEVFVEYDTALLTYDGISSTGTLSDGWSVQPNTEAGVGTLETIKIAMATDQSAATGAATLVNINFTVKDVRTPNSSALTLTHVLLNDGDPAHIAMDGSVTVVGNDAAGSTDVVSVIPRDDITVTIIDADEDLDGAGSTDQVSVTVSNGNQSETITLNETSTPGEFAGIVSTVFSASSTAVGQSGDSIVQAKAGDQIDFSFTDQLLSDGSGPVVLALLPVAVIGGADGSAQITDATQPGDAIYIKVTDPDLNSDNGAVETVQVVVSSSNGESETVTLTEVDVDDDVFFGSLASAAGGAGTDDDGTINGLKGDVLTLTYDDVVTALGDQLDRTDTDQVVNPFGDADGNLSVQAFDAAQTLLHVLVPHLTGLELIQANVDLDPSGTGITPFDASLILQKRVGLISLFPVQTAPSTNHPQATPASLKGVVDTRQLALSYIDGYLTLSADERAGILSGDVLVSGVDGKVVLGEELGQFIVSSRRTDEGLRIVFAGAEAVQGPGELLRIYPGVGPDTASLARAEFNDGRIQVLATAPVELGPGAFALHENWPNPFNPETSIRFELAQGSAVQLAVFDALGQKVRTLVDGARAAGSYQVLWDGRNARGAQVSSGVYFYRLQAGDLTQMRRMLLLK